MGIRGRQLPRRLGGMERRFRTASAASQGDGNTGAFLEMMNGDYRDFADQGEPQRSINFVTAHDGFCMLDLVAYDRKNNGGA